MATRLIRCLNGHVFDASATTACPTCGWTEPASATPGSTENSGGESRKRSGGEEIDNSRRMLVIGGGAVAAGLGAGAYFFLANRHATPDPDPEPAVRKPPAAEKPPVTEKPPAEPLQQASKAPGALPNFLELPPVEQTAQMAAARELGLSPLATETALVTRVVRLAQFKPTEVRYKQLLIPLVKLDRPMALNEAGTALQFGYAVNKDAKLAFDYLTRAASQGVVRARAGIAEMLLAGNPKPRDPDGAAEILTLAAKADGPGAGQALTFLKVLKRSLDGAGPGSAELFAAAAQKNWDLNIKIARALADRNIDSGLNALGERYWNGEGVPQDRAAAIEFWRKATAIGYSPASYNLSLAAKAPPTGSPNLVESLVWLLIAAIQTEDRARRIWFTDRLTEQAGLFDQSQWSAIRTLFAEIEIPGSKSR
ncbi:tetratricopeptide repeat protein [uncultured Rhodoblastus sp.]|uniref:tetratricopeptide repeat protein n=1 Tax=uncultured Rhodoblastus sp. TaxID=543037 RepID=UPI0025FACA3C|nr:tetratricopeptide repeat protein [uncultured Rhodoblastus sp.]